MTKAGINPRRVAARRPALLDHQTGLFQTWARPEAGELAKLYGMVAPNYAAVMDSFGKAQDAALQKK